MDARDGRADRGDVQRPEPGCAGASGSSVAGDPTAGERGAGASVAAVLPALLDGWSCLGRAGEAASRPAAAERDFRGERRSNQTHASVTDPDARLYRKSSGPPARLCHMGPIPIETRAGPLVDVRTTHATGKAEREAAEVMIAAAGRGRRVTLGADKAHDAAEHVAQLRAIGVTPHMAPNLAGRRSAIDGRTTRHPGYTISQRIRKRIEEPFGWMKATAGLPKTRHRGLDRVGWIVTLTATAANLIRLPKLFGSRA